MSLEMFKVGQKRPESPSLSLSSLPSHPQDVYTVDLVKNFIN